MPVGDDDGAAEEVDVDLGDAGVGGTRFVKGDAGMAVAEVDAVADDGILESRMDDAGEVVDLAVEEEVVDVDGNERLHANLSFHDAGLDR